MTKEATPLEDLSEAIIEKLNNLLDANTRLAPMVKRDWPPIMMAVALEKYEVVKTLLESGTPPDSRNSEGITPLMLAALLNQTKIMSLLISYGADVNLHSSKGFCALVYATYAGSLEAIKLLQQNGADMSISVNPKVLDEKKTFQEAVEFYISCVTLGGIGNPSLIYKNCGMTKQTFSKIRSSQKNYHPKKETALQLAIGLRLTLFQAEDLLARAGYFFDENSTVDKIIKNHISHMDYDIMKINIEIYKETGEPFLKEKERI